MAEHWHSVPEQSRRVGSAWFEYERWVQRSKSPRLRDHNSFDKAAREADSDEAAFDLWFSWWDEFHQSEVRHTETKSQK